jgi:hypothetical protein
MRFRLKPRSTKGGDQVGDQVATDQATPLSHAHAQLSHSATVACKVPATPT